MCESFERVFRVQGSRDWLVGWLGMVSGSEQLLVAMLYAGYLSPATYAASALRQALLGPVTNQIWLDITVVFSSVIFWLVGRKLDWREK